MSKKLYPSEQVKHRPFVDFAVSLPIVVLEMFAAAAGFYSSACPNGGDGAGWAFISVLLLPFIFPPSILMWPAVSFGLGVWVRPSGSWRRFAAVCLLSIGAMPLFALSGWLVARLANASARCSFGF